MIEQTKGGIDMQIRDLEAESGLDRATIRFYEREGLIIPDQKENG
jgi:DNA-binding transcriptional MerR regulator